jgi:zona occludens toxin
MAIKTYSGRPGSGKSYNSVANVIIPAVQAGRTVVTNVVLDKAAIFADYPDANIITFPFGLNHQDAHKHISLSLYPPGSVYVIDEGGKLFPTGLKVTNVESSLLTFFTEHRHSVGSDGYSSEIFVLCQENSQLAKFVRDLVDTTYHHVKLDKHGLKNSFRVDIYDGSINGASHRGQPLESKNGTYKPEIFKYYKSHTQKSELADTALEVSPDKRGTGFTIYRNAILGALALIPLSYFGYQSVTGLFSSGEVSESVPQVEETSEPELQTPALNRRDSLQVTGKGRTDPLNLSSDWRLSGVIQKRGRVVAIIESDDRSRVLDAVTSCDYDRDLSEWYCVLNGQIVASYTGPVWSPDDSSDLNLPFTD